MAETTVHACVTGGSGGTAPGRPVPERHDPPISSVADPGEAACAGPGVAEYIDRIADELHERVEQQRRVLRKVAGGAAGGGRRVDCLLIECPRLAALTQAVRETIDVLEETRGAFKSKRLEVMRRKLIDILAGR